MHTLTSGDYHICGSFAGGFAHGRYDLLSMVTFQSINPHFRNVELFEDECGQVQVVGWDGSLAFDLQQVSIQTRENHRTITMQFVDKHEHVQFLRYGLRSTFMRPWHSQAQLRDVRKWHQKVRNPDNNCAVIAILLADHHTRQCQERGHSGGEQVAAGSAASLGDVALDTLRVHVRAKFFAGTSQDVGPYLAMLDSSSGDYWVLTTTKTMAEGALFEGDRVQLLYGPPTGAQWQAAVFDPDTVTIEFQVRKPNP